MLGLLPPSSSEIFFTLAAARRMISWPVVVSPVKATLPMPGCAAMRGAGRAAGTGDHVDDTRREAGLQRQLAQAQRRQWRVRRGLEDAGVAGRQRRPELPRGHVDGEVPGHDQPHHADRLAQREVQAGLLGDRDGLAEQLVRGAGVVLEHEPSRERLAACAGDGLADVLALELRQLLVRLLDQVAETSGACGRAWTRTRSTRGLRTPSWAA